MITKIRTVSVYTGDQETALRFYHRYPGIRRQGKAAYRARQQRANPDPKQLMPKLEVE